jgi:hypothetical protein
MARALVKTGHLPYQAIGTAYQYLEHIYCFT